jgi:hypothetical protein
VSQLKVAAVIIAGVLITLAGGYGLATGVVFMLVMGAFIAEKVREA